MKGIEGSLLRGWGLGTGLGRPVVFRGSEPLGVLPLTVVSRGDESLGVVPLTVVTADFPAPSP
jgi:hypothetical protein